uniref:Ig-like domain-containing protein n=1 Tax=Astyanax mexicanus TaxID=7994 RepID=A0A3B1JWM6_ASTMX
MSIGAQGGIIIELSITRLGQISVHSGLHSAPYNQLKINAFVFIVAATHSLQFFFTTVTPVISIPEFTAVGQVDEEQCGYYDSNNRTVLITVDWLKNNEIGTHIKILKHTIAICVCVCAELHTLQRKLTCELDDNDGSKRGYDQFGYDGEELLRLDLSSETWIATVPQALAYADPATAQAVKHFLQYNCNDWLQKYVEYGKYVLERKVRPEVDLFSRDSSSPVVCHATGFFPKAVMITWQKEREELNEDVDLRETLSISDRSHLREAEKHDKYHRCKFMSGVAGNPVSVGLIVGVVVGALLLVVIISSKHTHTHTHTYIYIY